MSILPQAIIALLIWIVLLGTFISPELSTYATQLIALLLVFYIVVKHIRDRVEKKEGIRRVRDEKTLLFLSTYLHPKLQDLIDLTNHEENRLVLGKQLELIDQEVSSYLEENGNEVSKE
jgi:hypothetical protein